MAIRLVQGRITASIAANFTRSCPGKCAKVRITQLLAGRRGGGRDSGAGGWTCGFTVHNSVPRSNSGLEPQTFYNDGI